MEQGDTRKPSVKRRSAPGGPTPAGRTRRSRRAEQERKQGPARPCAPQSARPDQRPPVHTRTTSQSIKESYSRAAGDVTSANMPLLAAGSPKKKPRIKEVSNQKGAIELAKRLEQYWHGRGFPAARFWAEPISERFEKIGSYELYRVASNLVDGLPPRYVDTPGKRS
jgi:hypothetical protein